MHIVLLLLLLVAILLWATSVTNKITETDIGREREAHRAKMVAWLEDGDADKRRVALNYLSHPAHNR